MASPLQTQLEEDERHLAKMKSQNMNPADISNWEEGVRQKLETIEIYRLAREVLRNINFTGKGADNFAPE